MLHERVCCWWESRASPTLRIKKAQPPGMSFTWHEKWELHFIHTQSFFLDMRKNYIIYILIYNFIYIFMSRKNDVCVHIYISWFLKVCIMPLCFYGRHILEPVFTDQKESKEDFHLYKKVRITFSVCLAASRYGGSAHIKQRGPPKSPPQDLPSPSQHQASVTVSSHHSSWNGQQWSGIKKEHGWEMQF